MAKIYDSPLSLIGHTPLVRLSHIEKAIGTGARLLAKLESRNHGGSAKDRIALAMIEAAEASGQLAPGGQIIEPTSGNTGVGLAWVGIQKGYRVTLTMPETMSAERRRLLKALGAEVVLTPGREGMKGAIAKARELRDSRPGSVIPSQFDNPANPRIHTLTTAREIWEDTDGEVDVLVAGVGSGGTVSGTGRGLKEQNPAIRVVAVEPASSPVLSGGKPGPHGIQGIGAGFVPANYDPTVVDQVITVADHDAIRAARQLATIEGILGGISSGAALAAAISVCQADGSAGKTVVVVLPDTGERYLSTSLFDTDALPL